MDLEARVRRLESQNGRLKVVLALLTLVMFGVAAMAVLRVIELRREAREPAGPSLVQAERFILLDEQGNQRAVLGVGANEEAMLELNDSRGKPRLRMDVPSSGPGVTLRDDRGKVRALFTVYTDGPYLGMTDEDGNDLFQAPQFTPSENNPAGGP